MRKISRRGGQGVAVDPVWEYTPEMEARLKVITPTNEEFKANAEKLFPPQEWFDEEISQRTGAKE